MITNIISNSSSSSNSSSCSSTSSCNSSSNSSSSRRRRLFGYFCLTLKYTIPFTNCKDNTNSSHLIFSIDENDDIIKRELSYNPST